MRPFRVALLVGGIVLAVAAAWVSVTERHSSFQGTAGWLLLAAMAVFAIALGSLATLGTFLALRSAPAERLSYRTGVSLAVIYLVLCFATEFIPLDRTIIFREGASQLEIYVRFILFLALTSCLLPYLIALAWRLNNRWRGP